MPVQLKYARRPKRPEPRPTVELLPAISVHDIRHVIPRSYNRHNEIDGGTKYPSIRTLRFSFHHMEIEDYGGRKQSFTIKWARTCFGPHRPIFLCNCGRGAIRLYARYGSYKCRCCHNAVYTSQRQDAKGRKRFKAGKLRLNKLGGLPSIDEPIAPKAKWKHRARYQRLRNQVRALEASAKPKLAQPIPIQAFVYHLPS
jgi:hypothetical protein